MEYELIRSRRKTMSIKVNEDGTVTVHAPSFVKRSEIEGFLLAKEDWIEKTVAMMKKKQEKLEKVDKLSEKDIKVLREAAREALTAYCREYSLQMGVSYNRIAIKLQKTRWGSCSRSKNLNFNALLYLAPESVQRYVVVHELCHLKEMNHSDRFWNLVSVYCPDWKKERRWLKQNGDMLIARIPD